MSLYATLEEAIEAAREEFIDTAEGAAMTNRRCRSSSICKST